MQEVLARSEKSKKGQETVEVESFDVAQIADWPSEVRELFLKLPSEIQDLILPADLDAEKENSGQGVAVSAASERYDKDFDKQDFFRQMKSMETLLSSMEQVKREEWFNLSLHDLFSDCHWQRFFENLTPEEAKKVTMDFLDFIWHHRGEEAEKIPVYQKDYYDQFEAERQPLMAEVKNKMAEIEAQKASVKKTAKQKRLTESKTIELRQMEGELEAFQKELKKFDEANENDDHSRFNFYDVSRRKLKEKQWLESLVLTAEYFPPDELAVLVGENFDAHFFRPEKVVVYEAERGRREVKMESLDRAMAVLQSVATAVEEWSQKHESEIAFRETQDNETASEKQIKVAQYFKTLVESYRRGKAEGRTDEEMIVTVAQMRNSLTILGK